MGKLILCSGVVAEKPFHFKLTETNVYSIEELCYYIYNNIYSISEEIFDETMVEWLLHQVEMKEIAEKLRKMIEHHNSLKDIVVSILCSSDYYTEDEIQKIIVIMDEINNLIPIARNKIKADNLLKYKNYAAAEKEYESMLNHKEAGNLTTEAYGNILHNLAIAHIHTASFREAALKFKEAYIRNNNEESLRQYLIALKLSKREDEFLSEVAQFQVSSETVCEYMSELNCVLEQADHLELLNQIKKIPELKKEGRVSEYYQKIDDLIFDFTQTYKNEVG